ncbi:hypothetical protein C2I18_05340 [Paenibacillus sp. PK3_47]|nr:hypothetical protein C2I18_05340 [Paenibacillus sp. PK3_47]
MLVTILAWRGMQLKKEISGLLDNPAMNVSSALNEWQDLDNHPDADGSVAAVAAVYSQSGGSGEDGNSGIDHRELLEAVSKEGIDRRVHLKTIYVSGEEVQSLPGVKSPLQLKELITGHPEWYGWLSGEGDLWLERRVNDLSPLTKREAYIGVDEQGNLTLFKGPPAGEKVLKTFFQMDMGSMKSALPEEIWKQLHDGIRVQDIEEYNSVLSTFSDYARDSAEQAMQSEQ